jgi:hypothetical protein
MKKNLLLLIVLVAALLVSTMSCKKEDENVTPKEVIKIFMNAPVHNKSGLKSALSGKEIIAAGDTAYVWDIPDINITIFAEDEFGSQVEGSWSIFNIDNDRDINKSDTIAVGDGGRGALGSALSTKLKFLGLYLVNFTSKAGAEISFYILHKGIPGILGDNWKNDYAFRLDKEIYQINNTQGNPGYTLYLKYEEGEFPILNGSPVVDLNRTENFHALLFCGGNNVFVSKRGAKYQAKEFSLKRCKYSPGYFCFSFLSESTPSREGRYSAYFYSGTFGWNWWSFKSVMQSDWSKDGQIVFQVVVN